MVHETSKIVKSFVPIFYISKYFGCNLYPLPKVLSAFNVKMNLRAIDILICSIQIAVTFGLRIPLIKQWDDSSTKKDLESRLSMSSVVILSLTSSAAHYAYTFTCLTIMIFDMVNAPVIRSILSSLTNVDEQLERGAVKENDSYRSMAMLHALVILLNQILAIALGFALLAKEGNGSISLVFETYVGNSQADGCLSSFFVTYWFCLENVVDRIHTINECLRHYPQRFLDHTGEQLAIDVQNTNSIRDLSIHHGTLLNVIEKINRCYTLQFILSISMTFFFSVTNSFVFYKTMKIEMEHRSLILEMLYTSKLIYFQYLTYKIYSVGSRIKNLKQVTQSLLNKANVLCIKEEIRIEINNFSHQLGHSSVEISCGLFTVDWTLLYSISSAVGTYLLWFIQFDSIVAPEN